MTTEVLKKTSAAALLRKLDTFPWDDWTVSLSNKIARPYRDLVISVATKVAKDYKTTIDPQDPLLSKFMTNYVLERATQLDRTTKEMLKTTIQGVFDVDGGSSSISELRDLVLETVRERMEGYESWRALRIARSETAIAYNHANILGFVQAGLGTVEVLDGTEDDACADANGEEWTMREALANPIAHPNCQRTFVGGAEDQSRGASERMALMEDDDLAFICAIASEMVVLLDDPLNRSFED